MGNCRKTLNDYIILKKLEAILATAKFTAGRDEYLPVPPIEITLPTVCINKTRVLKLVIKKLASGLVYRRVPVFFK